MQLADIATLKVIEDPDSYEPIYTPGIKEEIGFQFVDGEVLILWVDNPASNQMGLTSCENDNGCLDYMVGLVLSEKAPEGFYIIEGAEVNYSSDYFSETDAELIFDGLRTMILSEIPDKLTPGLVWRQIVAAWHMARCMEFIT